MNTTLTIAELARQSHNQPVFAYRPKAIQKAADTFMTQFRGKPMFAVKTNPETHVLKDLYANGIRNFDVASLEEARHVRGLFEDVELFFMHPIKPRHAIRETYHEYGVKHFSLDSMDELRKILEETDNATDLNLHLRIAIPNNYSEHSLGEKFGISLLDAPALLAEMRKVANKLGVCFHVGSQCMHPDAYRIAMRMTGQVIAQAGVDVDYFNVGGGFPSIYPGMIPPAMGQFFDAIHSEFERLNGFESMQLLAEPGRALVAESSSVVVRVDARRGNNLYINDGTYGSLFDAGTPKFIFPVQLVRDGEVSSDLMPFSFYGPTCDSIDFMKGPFYLPSDVREGDMIEIGQLGAYGRTMATRFNGFDHAAQVIAVSDEPLMTLYGERGVSGDRPLEVIAA